VVGLPLFVLHMIFDLIFSYTNVVWFNKKYADTVEVEGILVTFVTCNYRNEYQQLQLGSGFKPTNN